MSAWRFLAQRVLTREWLHTDLPIIRDSGPSWELSAVGQLRGHLAPEIGGMDAPDGRPVLDEWGTFLYIEADGVIRWGGIVVASSFSVESQSWEVEAASFATYPHGVPFEGGRYARTSVDPAQAFRFLWQQMQEVQDADLGVKVVGDSTNVRIGRPATGSPGSDDYEKAEPYELTWWDAPDIGQELDGLAGDGPFDWTEHHKWNSDKRDVEHEIRVAYPRAGTRRTDLAFRMGENILALADPVRGGDDFANVVIGIGAGEGAGSLRRTTAVRDGRLRRPYLLEAKDVASATRLDTQIRLERTTRQRTLVVPSITVVDHTNASIGSWSLGDDILVQGNVSWLGEIALWHRIVAWELQTDSTARLMLERSDSFTYGGA